MLATVLHRPGHVALAERPEPRIVEDTDAVVHVVTAAVCGSDLWWYRGDNPFDQPRRMGHEFIGRVEQVGPDVTTVRPGDVVIAAFKVSDGTCIPCSDGYTSNCHRGSYWGQSDRDGADLDGGQGERVRVPYADGTLVPVPGDLDKALLPHLLALTDVMPTGLHAAQCAGVRPGGDVVVIGDGAVGLCAVLAARRLGAERVTIMSRHPDRQEVARAFGVDDVVTERGAKGVARLRELHGGVGADHVLECVGTEQSLQQAIDCTRPGGQIGMVGLPHGVPLRPLDLFVKNLGLRGGGAPARALIPGLLPDVLDGTLLPGAVFNRRYPLEEIGTAYADMAERRTIKARIDVTPV